MQEYHIDKEIPLELQQESVSVLAHSGLYDLPIDEMASVVFQELSYTYLVLRGDHLCKKFITGVEHVLNIALPLVPLTSIEFTSGKIYWISPDEWLIKVNETEVSATAIENALRKGLQGRHYALVNNSGGNTQLNVSGVNAINVLKKAVSYDVETLPVGKVVTTGLARAQAIICRGTTDQFELIIRRSFADYIYYWLYTSSLEYTIGRRETNV